MDNRVKALLGRPGQTGIVQDIPVYKFRFREEVSPETAGKVVKHGDPVTPVQEFPGDMTADVSGAADD
jgi:hypothetical protein